MLCEDGSNDTVVVWDEVDADGGMVCMEEGAWDDGDVEAGIFWDVGVDDDIASCIKARFWVPSVFCVRHFADLGADFVQLEKSCWRCRVDAQIQVITTTNQSFFL